MSDLIVYNEDIINNTGITLSNPTGEAGTYLLSFELTSIESSIIGVKNDYKVLGWKWRELV